MDAVNSFNTLVAGFLIGWWMRDISHWLRARLEPTASAPGRARHVDGDPAEPSAGTPAAGNPGADAVEGPFGQSRDGSGGNRPDYGDDDGFHGESVSQKQEGRK